MTLSHWLWALTGLALILPAWMTVDHALGEKQSREQVARIQSLEGKKSLALDWLTEAFTLGADDRFSRSELEQARLEENIARHHRAATAWGWFLAAGCGAFILVSRILQRQGRAFPDFFLSAVIWASFLFLAVGLLAPVFLFQKNLSYPLIGEVVYQFEMLSIPSAAAKLWEANPLVACLIVLFSMVTPLLKIQLSLFLLFSKKGIAVPGQVLVFLSKWSMADVFIVAVLLAVFSLSASESQLAQVGTGFYFFAGYCLLAHFHMVEMARRVPPRKERPVSD